jgi:hypothetical protein
MTFSLEEFTAMIPVYLNGRLSQADAEAFEDALERYPELKQELKEFSAIKQSYDTLEEKISVDSEALFSRIHHNIQSEKQKQRTPSLGIGEFLERVRQVVGNLFHSPGVSWSIAAVQFAAIIALVVFIPKENIFKTYTSTSVTGEPRARINVVFKEDALEAQIRGLLQETGTSIVDGPYASGLYVLEITNDGDLDAVISKLNESEIVRLAEKSLSHFSEPRSSRAIAHKRMNIGETLATRQYGRYYSLVAALSKAL